MKYSMQRPKELIRKMEQRKKMEPRPKIMYPSSYSDSGLSGTRSFTYRYMWLDKCVANITKH